MKWDRYRLKTRTAAEDMISYTLAEMGIEGVQIEDRVPLTEEEKKSMFIDILPDLGPDDGTAWISFYIEPEKDNPEYIADIMASLNRLSDFMDVGELSIEKTETADVDWMNNWKKFWKPFKVDDDIIIKPSWERLDQVPEGTTVVELDPGTAFGTGMHHTTRLCIAQLKKYLKAGDRVLDVGCGSGILSIIAMMLGAGEALAVDVDPNAVKYTRENARENHVDMEKFHTLTGDLISSASLREQAGLASYDLVLANILAEIIIPLSSVIGECMKKGGLFVSSGILTTREDAVRQALEENGFQIEELTHSGDWSSFTARKV